MINLYNQYQAALRPDEVDCKVHETLAFQEWIWTRRKPAERITFIQKAPVEASRILLNLYNIYTWKEWFY